MCHCCLWLHYCDVFILFFHALHKIRAVATEVVTPASLEQCSRLQQSRWCRYCFLLRTLQQRLPVLFIGPDNAQNCPFPQGTGPHVVHGFFGPPSSPTQTTSRSVRPFYRARERDQQTDTPIDRQTNHANSSVAIASILCNACSAD